jgi:uncharacterized protein with GYD domain
MPTYISLVQFTDKGIQAAKETTQRVADWANKVQSRGVSIKQMYWTLGQYDQVCVFEAPDDETAASVLWQRTFLGTSAPIHCGLSRPPRWRRFWPTFPNQAVLMVRATFTIAKIALAVTLRW